MCVAVLVPRAVSWAARAQLPSGRAARREGCERAVRSGWSSEAARLRFVGNRKRVARRKTGCAPTSRASRGRGASPSRKRLGLEGLRA